MKAKVNTWDILTLRRFLHSKKEAVEQGKVTHSLQNGENMQMMCD